jgi:hypothetical protein
MRTEWKQIQERNSLPGDNRGERKVSTTKLLTEKYARPEEWRGG